MRLFIVGAACLLASPVTAQSRWTLSTGPEYSRGSIPELRRWGVRFRAEYDLTPPNSVFGVRLEGGARWSPTQSYFFSEGIGADQFIWAGTKQQFDVMLGFNTSLSPLPRAPVAPYFSFGIFHRQVWTYGSETFGSSTFRWSGSTYGGIIGSLGLGLRARVGGRAYQLELRRLYDHNSLTFGTRLPF